MEELSAGLLTLNSFTLEQRHGFNNGALDWKSFAFDSLGVESVGEDEEGKLVLGLNSREPTATKRGLEKYERRRITRALTNWYGREVRLVLQTPRSDLYVPVGEHPEGVISRPLEGS